MSSRRRPVFAIETALVAYCYLLCATSGSSIDRYSNNVSLFGLVEQINLRPGVRPPPSAVIPVEIHAYFQLAPPELNLAFEMRLVVVAETGLETVGEVYRNRATGARFRVRSAGLPHPPVAGTYTVRVDFRFVEEGQEAEWQRQAAAWPLHIVQAEAKPRVTH